MVPFGCVGQGDAGLHRFRVASQQLEISCCPYETSYSLPLVKMSYLELN
jgi:hypothetical protein